MTYRANQSTSLEHSDLRKSPESQLSQYGSKSLGYSDRDIYNRQTANFDIISFKPKEYNETIKQYPKVTL